MSVQRNSFYENPLFCLSAVLLFITANISGASAGNAPEWNTGWKHRQEIIVQETAGLNRTGEPVEAEIQFRQPVKDGDTAGVHADIKREFRVVHYSAGNGFEEIPSQVFDIRCGGLNKKDPPDVSVRARIAFFTDVSAYSTERYFVYYGNPKANTPQYKTDLNVSGEGVEYAVENSRYRILTEKISGQIDQIDLKFATRPSLRFKYGTLHWNPDFIVVPDDFPTTGYTWYYAHHFENPPHEVESGPVFFSIQRKQLVPGQDTAYMEVYYRFYAGLPYFIMESFIEAKKDTRTFAIRNDELAFGRTDFTHAGWRNKTPDMFDDHIGEIGSIKIYHETRTGGHVLGSVLPPNMAWISLCHAGNGYGVGSIRLEWENRNVLTGEPSPIYNSHTVISEHDEGLYWFRSLIYSPRSSQGMTTDKLEEYLIDVPKGSSYREKNAYVFYEFDSEGKFAPVDELYMRLRSPLEVKVIK